MPAMNLVHLLMFIYLDVLALFSSFVTGLEAPSSSGCRSLFGDTCWPNATEFSRLQEQLSQPLLHPLPPASPCYPLSDPSGDCDDVHRLWANASFRATQPGAMQGSTFETFVFKNGTISACYNNTSLGVPCEQGSVPVVGVDARSDADIQAAVKFAAAHNLRVVVKSTGHDLSGRSTARGSFVIWTHNLNDITFHDTFSPTGAPRSETHDNAITLGAGVQWQEAYEAVNARNRVLVGGVSAGGTVGAAGGWILGGGHNSALSPTFGLGVDNVLQFTMISSTGTSVVVNAHQHPDLFFALRGGGGGTYGVVTSVTYQTHENLPLITAVFSASTNSASPSSSLQSLFTELVKEQSRLSDDGWAGFVSLAPDATSGTLSLSAIYVLVNGTQSAADTSIQPFFAAAQNIAANSLDALVIQSALTTPVDSFFDWLATFFPSGLGNAGTNGAIGSWLLPRDVIQNKPELVADTLVPLPGLVMLLVGGGAVSAVDPGAMGLNPAWRAALVHTIFSTSWAEGTPSDVINSIMDEVKQNMTTLRALAPHSGAYFNEASLVEPHPLQAFFGDHHVQLRQIKAIYDPIDMFVVREGIGSDEWDADLVCKL
ncbi:FAD-binding domain-containing protein [Ganoderma leucocontextum]|nr:FAD-binding domain-containing protein [Ganoderma leucocontextum]